ncbi:MAG: glycosyltransferase family 39 protein [Microgenomates group bacterium]
MTKYPPLWLKLKNKLPQIIFAFFLASIVFLLYSNLGRDALFDWDEGIYAELGRQLVVTKNIFITFWNGAAWLEKPPGIAWLSGLGIALAGPTAYGARLFMPLVAIYVLYVVYRIGTHLGNWKHGMIAAGVLASLNLFLGRTRAVNTDMALLASITTTILFLLESRPAWWVALAIFGGVWFKGIAGLMSVIIALPLFLQKPKTYVLRTIYSVLILIIPWHLYAYLKYHREFLTPYLFEQVLRRATAQIEFHFETRWYYFNYLYENLGIGVLLVAGLGAVSTLFTRKNLYLLWWVLAPLTIFTLAKTRLFWYILPIYPAISLLIAQIIGGFQSSKVSKNVVSVLAVGIITQAIMATSKSVELKKTIAIIPDRVQVAQSLGKLTSQPLSVLVPPSERLSEALLPEVAKLTSSFRYGGMPSVVYYYGGKVDFYYDVDKFRDYWENAESPLVLIAAEDAKFVPGEYRTLISTETYLGIVKGDYAHR